VWDPAERWTITADAFPDGTGRAPYAGRPVTGRIRFVCARGRALVRDGEPVDARPEGRLAPRGPLR
jgi:dihydropyrimidinase